MSQELAFERIKCFSEEFTENCKQEDILRYLQKILKQEDFNEEIQNKFFYSLEEEVESLYIPISKEIYKILSVDSPQLLHERSRIYFVDEKLWKAVRQEILKQLKNSCTSENENFDEDEFFSLQRDFVRIENYYRKKMLVVNVS